MGVDGSRFPLSSQSYSVSSNAAAGQTFQNIMQDMARQSAQDLSIMAPKIHQEPLLSQRTPSSSPAPSDRSVSENIQQGADVNLHSGPLHQKNFSAGHHIQQERFIDLIRQSAYEGSPLKNPNGKDETLLASELAAQVAGMGASQTHQDDLSLKEGGPTTSSYSESNVTADISNAPKGPGLPSLTFSRVVENYTVQTSAKNRKTEKAGSEKR
jgi:hypothetical protein